MLLLTITALIAVAAGIPAWVFIDHGLERSRTGPAWVFVVATATAFGIILVMVKGNFGLAQLDRSAAVFAARHATAASTAWLRVFTQLGGAAVLVPMAIVIALVEAIRCRRVISLVGYLTMCVGGQFLLVNAIKLIIDRTRPDLDRLTGFSGPSFPSGHAAAAAACFAAFALVLGRGRSIQAKAGLGGAAVALAAGIAASRVFLGVHWLTDVTAGVAIGWAWFGLSTVIFERRGLRDERASRALSSYSEKCF